jgi:hypothetical protein
MHSDLNHIRATRSAHLIFLDFISIKNSMKTMCYEVSSYASYSNPVTFHLSLVQIFSSAPSSQTHSVFLSLLISETKFCTHTIVSKSVMCYS